MNQQYRDILELSKLMYEKGMVNAFEGNLSVKTGSGIVITPSQICKGFLKQEMLVETDMKGRIIKGNLKPSSEILLHVEAYAIRDDIGAVIHAHTPYATAFAVANKEIQTRAYPEMIVLYGGIPLVPYGTPSTPGICAHLKDYLSGHDVVLLANHGIVAVGKDLYDAYFKLESVESIAKVLLLARLLGGEHDLQPDEVIKLYEMGNRKAKPD
ncbi:MAG: class II aldolase/adducin family protein [Clostridiaceae bacterium]|jgi:L-fuculose-phosphate aldolase|nr:class II aldolase/adducin family protein [Clostridiaceae bacterium]